MIQWHMVIRKETRKKEGSIDGQSILTRRYMTRTEEKRGAKDGERH